MITDLENAIRSLAAQYASDIEERIAARMNEIEQDDTSHYLIYLALGISEDEGKRIDMYQNKGRFLYKYAGAFLERAAFLCFQTRFPQAVKAHVPNTLGQRPKQFEIDCLIGNDAIEIKWRDATTDGDHITKEHTRIRAIHQHGYKPVRLMFYYPNRKQASKIQATLQTLYHGIGGEYYAGEEAWQYLHETSGIDLQAILASIAADAKRKEVIL